MNKVKISIITVCYNEAGRIGKTIESVKRQTYENIEYIVQDGGSQDGTIEEIKRAGEGYPVQFYVEPDHGIYDAMNKAAARATGDYVLFFNVGDRFWDDRVIENVAEEIGKVSADLIYGNIVLVDPDGNRLNRRFSQFCARKCYFLTGDAICHQAIFARRECVQKFPFLLEYSICADREWLLRLIEAGKRLIYANCMVCICEMEGFSSRNSQVYETEVRACVRKHFSAVGYGIYMMVFWCKKNALLRKALRALGKLFYFSKETGE